MGVHRPSLERGGARDAGVLRLCRAGLDATTFRKRLRAELARVVSFDAYCVNTADPETGAVTGSIGDGLPPEKTQRLFDIEQEGSDVNALAALAIAGDPVAVLGEATEGRPERSLRMREIFLPLGLAHELRAALVDGVSCWGYLHLLRRAERPDFSAAEAETIRVLVPHLAEALCVASLLAAGERDAQAAPGILTVHADGRLAHANAAAERWLAQLAHEIREPLPHALCALAARVQDDAAGQGEPPRCLLRTSAGAWLVAHGSRLAGETAIVLEKAAARDVAPVLLRAHGLTPRERDVAALLAEGLSNEAIAAHLEVTVHTVKDHLKALFAKSGAESRGELVARFFVDHD